MTPPPKATPSAAPRAAWAVVADFVPLCLVAAGCALLWGSGVACLVVGLLWWVRDVRADGGARS